MNPTLSNISEEGDVYKFTLSGLNVSLANALRRTILSDIKTLVFYTEIYKENECKIHVNTTRLHNEILKHRLSCIPVHETDLSILPGNYVLELDIQNETDNMIIVTTEHFKIRNKTNENYLTETETHRIFPPNPITHQYIDFVRLRPRIGDTIPGEQIKLTAEFSIHTARENAMFNVVSKCSYGNTIDVSTANQIWDDHKQTLIADNMTKAEIEMQENNFRILDVQRHFIIDSFDFVIQTIGVFDNKDIVKKACIVLQNKLVDMVKAIDSDMVPIFNSETTIEFCFDIILENEDYTLGKVLEYILYEKYFQNEKLFTFCGFKKFHPHNNDSTLRIAYEQNADKRMVAQHLRIVCIEAGQVFEKIYKMF
jgi:DNA-directed RNA polymerase alpha subunit